MRTRKIQMYLMVMLMSLPITFSLFDESKRYITARQFFETLFSGLQYRLEERHQPKS